jgi:hypothetical protein
MSGTKMTSLSVRFPLTPTASYERVLVLPIHY